jgi:hypothetical protein
MVYQDKQILDGSWKSSVRDTDHTALFSFDMYSLGIVLFELLTGLDFF